MEWGESMDNRFIAYVTLASAAMPPAPVVLGRIGQLFPSVPLIIDFHSKGAAGESFVFSIDDKLYTIIAVDQPLPKDAFARALELNRVWPEAAAAMGRQRAHLIVAALASPQSHGDAMEMASAISATVAALTTLTDAIAVVWSTGDVITEASSFHKSALGIAQHQLPIDTWIGFTWLDGPPTPQGQRTLAALTTGLVPFVGRELEWLPAPLSPVTIAQRLIGTCQYLIANGPVIGDNETLGISAEERIRVRHAPQGQRPGVPVMLLTVESLDQPPQCRHGPGFCRDWAGRAG